MGFQYYGIEYAIGYFLKICIKTYAYRAQKHNFTLLDNFNNQSCNYKEFYCFLFLSVFMTSQTQKSRCN